MGRLSIALIVFVGGRCILLMLFDVRLTMSCYLYVFSCYILGGMPFKWGVGVICHIFLVCGMIINSTDCFLGGEKCFVDVI